jgi:hypothetical protein
MTEHEVLRTCGREKENGSSAALGDQCAEDRRRMQLLAIADSRDPRAVIE